MDTTDCYYHGRYRVQTVVQDVVVGTTYYYLLPTKYSTRYTIYNPGILCNRPCSRFSLPLQALCLDSTRLAILIVYCILVYFKAMPSLVQGGC